MAGNDPAVTDPAAALGTLDEVQRRTLTAGLERIMARQAAELCARAGARRHGTRVCRIMYREQQLDVRVPRLRLPDGRVAYVPLYDELKPDAPKVKPLIDGGMSLGGLSRARAAESPDGAPKGSSTSNLHRRDAREQAQVGDVNERPLGGEPIVAVMMDGTELKRGRDKKHLVLVAIAITADGRKLVLATAEGVSENHELVFDLITRMVKRGLDPRVLWIVDGGAGLWKGIRKYFESVRDQIPQAPHIQNCTAHKARKVREELTKEIRQKVGKGLTQDDERALAEFFTQDLREKIADALSKGDMNETATLLSEHVTHRLAQAWGDHDAATALTLMNELARELDAAGYAAAAGSLRTSAEETLTVMRLGLSRRAQLELRTTNSIESAMRSIKKMAGNVTRSTKQTRLYWINRALLDAESRWTRAVDPPDLVALMLKLAPDRYDPVALLTRLPPTLEARALRIPVQDAAAEASRSVGEATWLGSETALGFLGLARGEQVATEDLARALEGRHVRTNAHVRASTKTDRRIEKEQADDGAPPGVRVLEWRLEASDPVSRLWSTADAERRAEIERALIGASERALERLTASAQAGRGVAATATLRVADGAGPDGGPLLRVDGLVVGVARGQDKLGSPVTDVALKRWRAREAADAGRASLNVALGEPERVPPAVKPDVELTLPAVDSLARNRRWIGSRRAKHIDERAKVHEARIRGQTDEWVAAARRWVGDPFAALDRAGATMTSRCEQDIAITLRSGRDVTSLRVTERKLRHDRRHTDDWIIRHAKRAAFLVALEREAMRRSVELDWPRVGEHVARAGAARAALLEPHRGALDARQAERIAKSADWLAAWLPDRSGEWLASQLAVVGQPLDDIGRELAQRGAGAPTATNRQFVRDAVQRHGQRAARWLALRGEIALREQARAAEQARSEPAPPAHDAGIGL